MVLYVINYYLISFSYICKQKKYLIDNQDMTTATINLDYNQIRNIVMQMPLQERQRLSDELNELSASCVSEDLPHYSMAEINARIDEAEDDIANGRVYSSEEMHNSLEDKFPWLCE